MGGLTHVLHAHGGLTTHTCPPTWSIESLQYPVYLLPYLFQSTIQQARSNSSTTFKPFPGSCCQVIPLLLLTHQRLILLPPFLPPPQRAHLYLTPHQAKSYTFTAGTMCSQRARPTKGRDLQRVVTGPCVLSVQGTTF